ncbi:hypothetical protein ACGFX4_26700 [Kitasatospora sp. NPDC048365]|uniref:hypothetical protein n=1 Tax=Kitasatospora sp. NPDC048365 TaxID=3364050 RepID=UPI00371DFD0C
MRPRTLTLAAAPLLALLTLSACSSGTSGTPGTSGSSAAAAPAASSDAGAATGSASADPIAPSAPASKAAPPADAGLPAKPDAAGAARLIAALDTIDKDIVGGKPDKAIDNARNQCQAVYNFPKDHAKLVDLTNQRFTSAAHPNGFGPETAEKILAALQATLCPAR